MLNRTIPTPAKTGLKRVSLRPKLADEIADTLRQAILAGTFEAGEHLVLESLASQLGVSMMPVREALIGLANEGLVDALPRRGFRARPLDEQDLQDLFDLHAYLAGVLAGRAAGMISDDEVARLRVIHDEFVNISHEPATEANAQAMHALNMEFHRHINRIPNGDRLRWFLRLATRFVRTDSYEVHPNWVEATLKDHPLIIEALASHDAERTRGLVETHFRRGAENVSQNASKPLAQSRVAGRKRSLERRQAR